MATATISMDDGITTKSVTVSDTTPMIQRAQDATSAINTACSFSDGRMKVIWSFRIVAGFNDRIEFAANLNGTATNVNCTIPADNYTSGAALAAAMQTAMQAAEDAFAGGKRVDITVTYTGGNKFNFAWVQVRATISQFIIRGVPSPTAGGYAATALDTVGIQKGSDQVGAGASGNFDGDYVVLVNRFKFGYSGLAAHLRMADAAFTAEGFFGITDTTNQAFGAYLCGLDMTDPAPEAPPPPRPGPVSWERPAPIATTGELLGGGMCVPKGRWPKLVPFTGERLGQDHEFQRFMSKHFDWGEAHGLSRIFSQLNNEQRAQFLKLDPREIRQRVKDRTLIGEGESEWDWLKPEPRSPLRPQDFSGE